MNSSPSIFSGNDDRQQKRRVPHKRRRMLSFFAVSLLIGFSFFARHIAGMLYTNFQYSCLVYNPKSVRENPAANYDFMPEDVSWDETRWYGRWTTQVLRGEWSGANLESYSAFLTSPVPHQRLWLRDRMGPLILAGMARLPGSSLRIAFLAADLLFPIGIALSLLYFAWVLRPSVSFAVAATALIMFFNWQDSLNFLAFLRGARQNSATFLRTPYPQLSMIVFTLFLLSLLRLVRRGNLTDGLWFALLLTLNMLTYFYSWTYALLFVGMTILLFFVTYFFPNLQVDIPGTNHRRYTLLALTGGTAAAFLTTSPVWAGIVIKNPIVQDAFIRGNGTLGHRPDLKYSSVLLLLLVALLLWRRCRWQNRWLAVVYLAGSLCVMNIQLLAGKTIQPEHWAAYYIQPLFLIFALDFCWICIQRNGRLLDKKLAVILLAAGVLTSVYKLSIGAQQAIDFNRRDPAFEQLLTLLHQPALQPYGFISNDEYIDSVLPAFVIEKPLRPLYHDPLTDAELASLKAASERALEARSPDGATLQRPSSPIITSQELAFKTDRILFVLNRHRFFSDSLLKGRQVLLQNEDFLVITGR